MVDELYRKDGRQGEGALIFGLNKCIIFHYGKLGLGVRRAEERKHKCCAVSVSRAMRHPRDTSR